MARILVTGASGLLGLNLALGAAQEHEVVGVWHRRGLRGAPFEAIQADLRGPDAPARLLDEVAPEWVIHCAALADLEACERNPELADTLNAALPGRLATAALKRGIRLVHVSTDAVFDGKRGNYSETDQPWPLNVYGRSKLAGERAVLEANPEALVARVNFYGWSLSGERSLGEFFFNALSAGRPVKGLTDRWFSPLLANDLGERLLTMVEQNLQGLYHVGASDAASKYEFGVQLAQAFGLDAGLIEPATADTLGYSAARAPDLSLDTTKLAKALARPLPTVAEGLARFQQLYLADYPQQVQSLQPPQKEAAA